MLFLDKLSNPPASHMHITKKKSPTSDVVLYPVLKADDLLLTDFKRRRFIRKINEYTGLEHSLYQTLYETTIVRFVELVQALPYQNGGIPGGLMDYSLEHAVAAIRHYHESAEGDFSPLYAYALFTAALFQNVGKIISQQTVMISDAEGKFIAEWLPFEGSLLAVKAKYYKFRRLDSRWVKLGQSAAPLLARQCMPEPGFEWIASDSEIFSLWMAVLRGEKEQSGEFLNGLQLSNLIGLRAKKDRLPPLMVSPTRPVQTAAGEDFVAWLNAGLNDGSILVNTSDASVHISAQGELLLEAGIFQEFCKVYGRSTGWAVVCKQFNMLGLTKSDGENVEFEKFFSKAPVTISNENIALANPTGFFNTGTVSIAAMVREGLIVTRPSLFYRDKPMPENSNLTSNASKTPATHGLAEVEAKARNWALKTPLQKPFLA
jgi:hypothetical protein